MNVAAIPLLSPAHEIMYSASDSFSSLDSPGNVPTRLDTFLSTQSSIGARHDARVARPRLIPRRWAPRQSFISVQASWFSRLFD